MERAGRGHKLCGTWAEKRIRERRLYIYLGYMQYTVIPLLQARASIRIITVHGDGAEPLSEATSATKVCSSNLSIRVAILKC